MGTERTENEVGGAKKEGEEGVVHEGRMERVEMKECVFEKAENEELQGNQEGARKAEQ